IRCKHFRYALEFVADVYGAPARRLARRARDVQDVLGERQDARVVTSQLLHLAAGRRPKLSSEAVGELADVVDSCGRRGAISSKKLSKLSVLWDDHAGKELRRALASPEKAQRDDSPPPLEPREPSIEGTES